LASTEVADFSQSAIGRRRFRYRNVYAGSGRCVADGIPQ
jgi:hypothetical protein